MNDIRLTHVRPLAGGTTNILIRGDTIAAIGPQVIDQATPEAITIDGRGMLALPGFVNAHAHVDKSWWGKPWVSGGGAGGTDGRIAHERTERDRLGLPSLASTRRVLAEFLRHGTTDVLSHVDVDTGVGLRGIEVVQEAVASFGGAIRVELVAFPQDGVLRRPGVEQLLRDAIASGVRVIGGLDPASIDRDPVGQLDLLFGMAVEHGVALDIHLHDLGELGVFEFELIIERTIRLGLQGRVTISHGFALAQLPPDRQESFLDQLAEADIGLATVTPVNLPALPLREMVKRHIRFGLGTDGIRDLWSPFGDGDLLRLASTLARKNALIRDDDLALVLDVALGRAGDIGVNAIRPVLAVGALANIVLVAAETLAEAVAGVPGRQTVIAHGQPVVIDGIAQPILRLEPGDETEA